MREVHGESSGWSRSLVLRPEHPRGREVQGVQLLLSSIITMAILQLVL